MNRLLRLLILPAFLISGLLASAASISAQEGVWQRPFEVSKPYTNAADNPYSTAWFPNLAVSPDGSVHVVWYSGIQRSSERGDSLDLLMYRVLRNGRWSDVNNIVLTTDGGYTVRNSIAIGRDGRLHVSLRSRTKIAYTSAPWEEAWSARSWKTPYPVSSQNGAYYNSIAVDSRNILHVVWSETIFDDTSGPVRLCHDCANLFYRRSTDNGQTWSSPINLSNSPDGDNRPQIVIDSLDRIHVVWDNGRDWYAGAGVPKRGVYRRSDDGGQTWSAPVSFAPPKSKPDPVDEDGNLKANPDAPQQTTLAVRRDGNPVVVYRTVGGKLYFQTSNDGGDSWNPPRPITSVTARDTEGDYLDKYSMVTDGAGNVHLLMVGYAKLSATDTPTAKPPALLRLIWNGASWSLPEAVIANEMYPEYPTAAISGNTIHVVWYSRSAEDRFTSDRSRYRVWYTQRTLSGAALPPLQLFTPVPVSEPTVVPTAVVAPSPTALLTSVIAAPALERPPAWEAEAMPLILLAILPTVAVIGLITGLLLILRRRQR
jgi:hypothetical protein